ncbi:hypothetical protein E2C01_014497 [Portunus trituberculatus]|uniref:Uncharacterized protein n=1 Tax=Portunus trituberculatus TaxID=210409 RepID=A0A5B7DKB8_PORTR|nr:hypothetical protein [Portunus trituberculatus]
MVLTWLSNPSPRSTSTPSIFTSSWSGRAAAPKDNFPAIAAMVAGEQETTIGCVFSRANVTCQRAPHSSITRSWSGPRIESCGTDASTGRDSDVCLLTTTLRLPSCSKQGSQQLCPLLTAGGDSTILLAERRDGFLVASSLSVLNKRPPSLVSYARATQFPVQVFLPLLYGPLAGYHHPSACRPVQVLVALSRVPFVAEPGSILCLSSNTALFDESLAGAENSDIMCPFNEQIYRSNKNVNLSLSSSSSSSSSMLFQILLVSSKEYASRLVSESNLTNSWSPTVYPFARLAQVHTKITITIKNTKRLEAKAIPKAKSTQLLASCERGDSCCLVSFPVD